MIIPTTGKVLWTDSDADQLRTFLETSSGQRFISKLLSLRPDYKPFVSIERRAVESGQVEGYEECIKDIATLSEPNQK